MNSKHKTVTQYKQNYENIFTLKDNKSWTHYWSGMVQEGCWVDSGFVQMTSWFHGLNILLLTTSTTQKNPFIRITGNVTNELEFSLGSPLLLGNYTNVHYQSLVPLNTTLHHEHQPNRMTEEIEKGITTKDDFVDL